MDELPDRKRGWELVEYDREWLRGVARLTYEHPRHGTRAMLRNLRTGTVHALHDEER